MRQLKHLETEVALCHQADDGEEDFYTVLVALVEDLEMWNVTVAGWDSQLHMSDPEYLSESEARQAGMQWLESYLLEAASSSDGS